VLLYSSVDVSRLITKVTLTYLHRIKSRKFNGDFFGFAARRHCHYFRYGASPRWEMRELTRRRYLSFNAGAMRGMRKRRGNEKDIDGDGMRARIGDCGSGGCEVF
jgi:hypothetical protein